MKVHQNVVIDGVDYGESQARKKSKFYNENRWANFIEPLIDGDCSDKTFIELGCNAGLFLKMAKDRGFKEVYGVEADENACEVSKKLLGDVVRNEMIDEDFDISSIPCVDYLMMSNFHYHLHLPVLIRLIHALQRKANYVILVSSDNKSTRHKIHANEETTRHLFRHFKEVKHIPRIPIDGDTKPRQMFSFLFKTDMSPVSIQHIKDNMGKVGYDHYEMAKRRNRYVPLTEPILINKNGRIIDGTHRLISMERRGFKNILAETI